MSVPKVACTACDAHMTHLLAHDHAEVEAFLVRAANAEGVRHRQVAPPADERHWTQEPSFIEFEQRAKEAGLRLRSRGVKVIGGGGE